MNSNELWILNSFVVFLCCRFREGLQTLGVFKQVTSCSLKEVLKENFETNRTLLRFRSSSSRLCFTTISVKLRFT